MPILDGYGATKQIKSKIKNLKSKIQTVVIAVTASSLEEERAVILATECDDFLRKPFRDQDIFELMTKHLGARFVYEEEQKTEGRRQKAEGQDELTPEALAELPAKWLETLKQGAERADFLLLFSMIEQIREQDARLADALAQLAEDFEYDEILALLQAKEAPEERR